MFSIVVNLGFSSSATLNVKNFKSWKDFLNYFSAIFGGITMLTIITIIPLCLYFKKKDNKIDTEDAYLGMIRHKKFS